MMGSIPFASRRRGWWTSLGTHPIIARNTGNGITSTVVSALPHTGMSRYLSGLSLFRPVLSKQVRTLDPNPLRRSGAGGGRAVEPERKGPGRCAGASVHRWDKGDLGRLRFVLP
jgi:hypothetical protein